MVDKVDDFSRISFQGVAGAYSHLALKALYPNADAIAAPSFEHAINMVIEKKADTALIPVENSQWGRVTDVHHLLPKLPLYIYSEHFHRVRHKLLGIKGAKIADLQNVYSHPQALGQCRKALEAINVTPVPHDDTAGSAKFIAQKQDKSLGAIASDLAADIYDLDILKEDFEDAHHNTTRFLLMRDQNITPILQEDKKYITSFTFATKNIASALYKTLGGFATHGINMLRIESYIQDGSFISSHFYAEIEGHTDIKAVQNAFDELSFFTKDINIIGVYQASKSRL